MKKLLVVLLALTVLGVFAFADDAAAAPTPVTTAAPALKVTGWVDAGIESVGGNADYLRNYDLYNSGDALTRGLVNFSYTSGDFVYTLEAVTSETNPTGATGGSMPPVAIDVASAKANFFGGILGVEFGTSNNSDFGVQGDNGANYFGQSGYNENGINGGIVVTLKPVPGLAIGYGLPVINGYGTIENGFDDSRFGLAFSVPKMFAITAGYVLVPAVTAVPGSSGTLGSYNATTGVFTAGTSGSAPVLGEAAASSLDASFSLSAIDNLGLVLEAYLVNIGRSDKTNATLLDVGVNYTIGAIQPGVQFDYWLYQLSSATTEWYVKPYVNYTMDKTVFGAWFKVSSSPDGVPFTASTLSADTCYDVCLSVKQNFTPTIYGAIIADYGNGNGAIGEGNTTGPSSPAGVPLDWNVSTFSLSGMLNIGF